MLIRTYNVGPAILTEYADGVVHTRFKADDSFCQFAPPRDEDGNIISSFCDAATDMGYSDPRRYAVEHEIAHHIVAKGRGLEHSPIVWDAAHGVPMSLDEPERAAEEHLVNRLQRFANLGLPDEHGCLEAELGSDLAGWSVRLIAIARPWLRLHQ